MSTLWNKKLNKRQLMAMAMAMAMANKEKICSSYYGIKLIKQD